MVANTRSPLRQTTVSSHEIPGPTQTPLSSNRVPLTSSESIPVLATTRVDAPPPNSTPFPVPTSTSPGIDDGPSLTSTPPIDQSPSASLRNAPVTRAGAEFIDAADAPSPANPTSTGGLPLVVTPTTTGGPVDTSIPDGEISSTASISPATAVPSENGGAFTDPAPNVVSSIAGTGSPNSSVGNALTIPASSDTPLGNGNFPTVTGTSTITAQITPTITTTGITSAPSSVISG